MAAKLIDTEDASFLTCISKDEQKYLFVDFLQWGGVAEKCSLAVEILGSLLNN